METISRAAPRAQGQDGIIGAPRVGFQISNWKPYTKNTLQGFLSLELPSGMIVHDCTLQAIAAVDRYFGGQR